MPAVFTKDMKSTHTIYLPEMLEYHFPILKSALTAGGYRADILSNRGREIFDAGKRFVHNDMCFPAIAIIGQIINALENGLCDPRRSAFLLPQTGGACRASNYPELLKKALEAAGYGNVPVISLNAASVNLRSGFGITPAMIKAAVKSVLTGDLLMHLAQQTEPYEKQAGAVQALVEKWQKKLWGVFAAEKLSHKNKIKEICTEILESFSEIEITEKSKPKIGIAGELYIKYCRIGNLDTERFLVSHGCEIRTTGFSVYCLYVLKSVLFDDGADEISKRAAAFLCSYLSKKYDDVCRLVDGFPRFTRIPRFSEFMSESGKIISPDCITGDGWLISAEAQVLYKCGYKRLLFLNPFGCLVSHINCKGAAAEIRKKIPEACVTSAECDCDGSEALFYSRLLLAAGNGKIFGGCHNV